MSSSSLSGGAPGAGAAQALTSHDALLHLDPQIRLYVLLPITIAMFFVGVIRHNVSKIFGQGASSGKKIDHDGLKEAQAVVRATRIAQNCGYLSEKGFEKRREYFCNETVWYDGGVV